MTASAPVVIVGASLGGATTALSLRDLGYDGDIVLVGEEPELPYERPALSKEYLLGSMTADQLQVRPRKTYDDLRIELRLGMRATRLDVASRDVCLDGGHRVGYGTLVIATGASNMRPPIPGLGLDGVHQLRTLPEAAALRAAAEQAHNAVVVGMGFIGCEIASTLRQLDLEVSTVDSLDGPLLPQLGPQLSDRVRSWHDEHGVRMLFGTSVTEIAAAGSGLAVTARTGEVLTTDLVVVGVGARPNVSWLEGTPLADSAGVAVGSDGASAVVDVYAVGDVAAMWDERTGRHRRFEHWSNALEQGRRLAHTILRLEPPPMPAPYFWSAQYGHYLQYVGEHTPGAHLVTREVAGRTTGFYVEGGLVQAAVTVDNGKELRRARALLGQRVDARDLADPGVDLRDLGARVTG